MKIVVFVLVFGFGAVIYGPEHAILVATVEFDDVSFNAMFAQIPQLLLMGFSLICSYKKIA